jgi:hypothetical protein
VGRRSGKDLLRAPQHTREETRRMNMSIDKARQEHPPAGIDYPCPLRAPLRCAGHPPDHAILDEQRDAVAHRPAGAVKEAHPGDPQSRRPRLGRSDQCRKSVRHSRTPPTCSQARPAAIPVSVGPNPATHRLGAHGSISLLAHACNLAPP